MPRINVWIEAMKLKKIDAYCKERGISRSRLLVRGALSMAHSQPIPPCEYSGCRNPSIGKYKVLLHDWETGESENEMRLCAYHYKKAKAEGEIEEI
jgi:hypothetical protein